MQVRIYKIYCLCFLHSIEEKEKVLLMAHRPRRKFLHKEREKEAIFVSYLIKKQLIPGIMSNPTRLKRFISV